MNETPTDGFLKELSEKELKSLKTTLLNAYQDIYKACSENNLNVMLIGGSLLGSVRHKGFIPWDDDFDLAMSRKDFEKLKSIFDEILGTKYELLAPNYKNAAKQRFPQILIRNTRLSTINEIKDNIRKEIRIDIFIIEYVPENKFHRCLKGHLCNALMYIAGLVQSYENDNILLKQFMSQTNDGAKFYQRRLKIGRLFSFFSCSKWFDIIDKFIQYNKKSSLSSLPTGRKHYFGEILPTKIFHPTTKGIFENCEVNIPNGYDAYLKNLYGDYMQIPPVEKREKHFICDICFDTTKEGR